MLFQVACILLIIVIPFALTMCCKKEDDEVLDLVGIQVASANNDGLLAASAPPAGDMEMGFRGGRRTSL